MLVKAGHMAGAALPPTLTLTLTLALALALTLALTRTLTLTLALTLTLPPTLTRNQERFYHWRYAVGWMGNFIFFGVGLWYMSAILPKP